MKAIKLLLLAIVLLGAVIGLLYMNSSSESIEVPKFSSAQANEWKKSIEDFCQDRNWSTTGYSKIETGIHTDNVSSEGRLINNNEEGTLKKYLFSLSCSSFWENADKYFKQNVYSEKKIEDYKLAVSFLKERVDTFGKNSNLTNLSGLLEAYDQLMRSLGFNSRATYSRPLKAFSGGSAEALQSRIRGLKYYDSHFRHNSSIKSRVDALPSERSKAEKKYYELLEQEIEKNYKVTGRIEELLEDQMRFNEIATNESAIERLTRFVNNPNN